MFSDLFIRRPILATVCSLLIILAGAIAIPNLPIARYPELAPPSVTVTAFYTGANAQAVESAVTTPLEQAINGVEGMTYMTSSSTNSGVSTIIVTFDVGRNPDLAAIDVQNRVNQALGRMPADVRTTGITVTKNTTGFLGGIGFYSRDNRYDAQFVSNYVDLYVKDALKRVPGVGNIILFGERKFAMRLWLDPGKLAARDLTAGDVVNALREQNLQVAAGALGDAPGSTGAAVPDQRSRDGTAVRGARSSKTSSSRPARDGALVRMRDVGRVELGAETYSSNLRYGGLDSGGHRYPAAADAPMRSKRFSGVTTEMARLEKSFPPGLEWRAGVRQRRRRPRVDHRSAEDACRSDRSRRPRDVPVPPELAQHDHPGHHDPGVAHRHVRVHQAVRLLDQHADAVRHRARHRHRRRRCDRRHREHRAAHARGRKAARRRRPSTPCERCSARSSSSASCWWRCSCRWRSSPAPPAGCISSSR